MLEDVELEPLSGICNPNYIIKSYHQSCLSTSCFVRGLFTSLEEADKSMLDVVSEGKTLLYLACIRGLHRFVVEVIGRLKDNPTVLQEVLLQKWEHEDKWGNLLHVFAFEKALDCVLDVIFDAFGDYPEVIDVLFSEKAWNKANPLQIAVQSRESPEQYIEKVLKKVMNPLRLMKMKGSFGYCLVLYALYNKKYEVLPILKKYDETYVRCCIELYKERVEWYDIERLELWMID